MSEDQWKQWRDEFEALGSDGVLKATSSGKWRQDKIAAARLWLQQEDGRRWQPVSQTTTESSKNRRAKLIKYAIAGVLILVGGARLLKLLSD